MRLNGEQLVLNDTKDRFQLVGDAFLVVQHTNKGTQFIDSAVSFYSIIKFRDAQTTYQ